MVHALLVLPTLNEADNIEAVLGAVRRVVPFVDILVVDDASTDGTADLADTLADELGCLTVLRRSGPRGLGHTYRAGFAVGIAAGYDVLLEMDADLSHDPADIPALLEAIAGGADLAIGSRYAPGGGTRDWSATRRVVSGLGCWYAGRVLALGVRDATSGFRAYRANLVGAMELEATRAGGYAFQIEMVRHARRRGARIVEIPITFQDRTLGHSKMSVAIAVEALLLVTRWALRDRITHRHAPPSAIRVTPS